MNYETELPEKNADPTSGNSSIFSIHIFSYAFMFALGCRPTLFGHTTG